MRRPVASISVSWDVLPLCWLWRAELGWSVDMNSAVGSRTPMCLSASVVTGSGLSSMDQLQRHDCDFRTGRTKLRPDPLDRHGLVADPLPYLVACAVTQHDRHVLVSDNPARHVLMPRPQLLGVGDSSLQHDSRRKFRRSHQLLLEPELASLSKRLDRRLDVQS